MIVLRLTQSLKYDLNFKVRRTAAAALADWAGATASRRYSSTPAERSMVVEDHLVRSVRQAQADLAGAGDRLGFKEAAQAGELAEQVRSFPVLLRSGNLPPPPPVRCPRGADLLLFVMSRAAGKDFGITQVASYKCSLSWSTLLISYSHAMRRWGEGEEDIEGSSHYSTAYAYVMYL
jgi:hypothetical protein